METPAITIQGSCDPAFGKVKDAFARNFTEQDEHGAAVAVYRHGKPIIDLSGRDVEAAFPGAARVQVMFELGKITIVRAA